MKKIIKITEAQLRETQGEAFKYLDSTDDTNPFNGTSTITAQGKLNGEENAEPTMADKISKSRTPQAYARYRTYGNLSMRPHVNSSIFDDDSLDEGVNISSSDKNMNGVPDHYENVGDMGGLDTLSDGDDTNNITVIPRGIDVKLDTLLNAMSSLTPKQKAMVVNALLEKSDISSIPNSWKKELMYKVMSNNDNPNKNSIK